MQQLELFSVADPPDPCDMLKEDTDPEFVLTASSFWNDGASLTDYRSDLEMSMLTYQEIPMDQRMPYERSALHDLRDSIRVISQRITEITH